MKSAKVKKRGRGKPAKFSSPEEIGKKIDLYFEKCPDVRVITSSLTGKETIVPCPTITGLALFLGFCSRQSMFDYESKPEYSYTIKKARIRIERIYESMLHSQSCTGAIFALKNFGWRDKTEVEHSGEVKFNRLPPITVGGKEVKI